jgi:hypothetical protein
MWTLIAITWQRHTGAVINILIKNLGAGNATAKLKKFFKNESH